MWDKPKVIYSRHKDGISLIYFSDWATIRIRLWNVLQSKGEFDLPGEPESGGELFAMLEKKLPDVIIMDFRMSDMDGMKALSTITRKYPSVKVIVHTLFNQAQVVFSTLAAGATGYLSYDSGTEELYNAIRATKQTGIYLAVDIRKKVFSAFQKQVVSGSAVYLEHMADTRRGPSSS